MRAAMEVTPHNTIRCLTCTHPRPDSDFRSEGTSTCKKCLKIRKHDEYQARRDRAGLHTESLRIGNEQCKARIMVQAAEIQRLQTVLVILQQPEAVTEHQLRLLHKPLDSAAANNQLTKRPSAFKVPLSDHLKRSRTFVPQGSAVVQPISVRADAGHGPPHHNEITANANANAAAP